ncbi:MAG: ATP-binding cassette domain-containing protein, partial [Chitinophagaceae bacterium]
MTRITQQQPESYLWMAAVLLRGTIDAGNYKQFIFPLLLLKRLCDVSDEETVTALRDSGRDEDFALFPENHRSQVRAETHWREIRKVNRDVGQALRAIETANPSGETQVKPLPRPQPRRCRRRPRVGWKVPSNSKLHFPYCFALHPLVENALETPFTLHFMSAKPEPVYAPILKSASIRKFGLFTDEALEFSPGINVIIGRNGCGKSHLLKLLYTLVKECGETPGNSSVLESEKLENRLAKKLAGVFRPDNDRIGRLVQRGKGRGGAEVSATFSNEKKCGFK